MTQARDLPTAVDQSAAVRSGEVTAAALAEAAIERIDRWEPLTNAYSQVWRSDAARYAAKVDATERLRTGPLAGVPIAVKDLFDVAGFPTTGCSRFYQDNVASTDSEVVRRLHVAGAVIVGKTNQHELAMGGTNLISACGPTRNPFGADHITGGSSGGSAAAVATRTVAVAMGTDTGGSIRNPASMCGIFGLMPGQDRVSLEGVLPLAPTLDRPGPMAATVADLTLVWRVIAAAPPVARVRPVARVGVLDGFFDTLVHPAVRAAREDVIASLLAEGLSVVEVDGAGAEPFLEAWTDLVCMELVASHPGLDAGRDLLFPRTASFVERGVALSERERGLLRGAPAAARRWLERRLEGVDVLLAPSAPYPAPLADADEVDMGDGTTLDVHLGGTSRFTRPVNLTGAPALTIPAGVAAGGLPVGVQFIGRWNEEDRLLDLAARLEAADQRFRSKTPTDA